MIDWAHLPADAAVEFERETGIDPTQPMTPEQFEQLEDWLENLWDPYGLDLYEQYKAEVDLCEAERPAYRAGHDSEIPF